MGEGKGTAPENQTSLFSVMASTLSGIEERRCDLGGVIAVLSLFNLFGILNLVNDQVLAAGRSGGLLPGRHDLLTAMLNLLGGGKGGMEAMLNLMQSLAGKKLAPDALSSLFSMAGGAQQEGGEGKPKPEQPQEKRLGRSAF